MNRHNTVFQSILFSIASILATAAANADDVYQSPEDFIAEAFENNIPTPQVLWLTQEIKEGVKDILGHDYSSFRIRYWLRENRSAWILEEIGKVKPITTGIVVEDGKIMRLKVLIYRESHGWEVKYPFFTKQFKGRSLKEKSNRLDRKIDGISGATLSVNALRNLSRLALYLDQKTHGTSGK